MISAFAVNFAVNRTKRGVSPAMKQGVEAGETTREGQEGSNLSTGTSEDRGGISNKEGSGLGCFLSVWIPGLTTILI